MVTPTIISMKLYNVIYADPPWRFNDKMTGHPLSLDRQYPTESVEWISSVPVRDITAPDCALFLWAVSALLPEAMEVIQRWGFRYKTVAFCWVKSSSKGRLLSNLGRWTMSGMELCLLATKGKPVRIHKDVKQLVFSERTIHSRKPPEVRRRIVEVMGDVPRLELFARPERQVSLLDGCCAHDGWDVWGNEVASSNGTEAFNTPAATVGCKRKPSEVLISLT